MDINTKLLKVQMELKAPKNRKNTFGKYQYRSCEDILEAVKPCLSTHGLVQVISDEVVEVGERVYVKSTVTVKNIENDEEISVTAYAREADNKKGFDESQLTGSTSSYARKYALNGMYSIDDTQDSDSTNNGEVKKTEMTEKIEKAAEHEVQALIALAKTKGQDEESLKLGAYKYYRINDLRKLPKKSLADLKDKISKLADVEDYEGTPFA